MTEFEELEKKDEEQKELLKKIQKNFSIRLSAVLHGDEKIDEDIYKELDFFMHLDMGIDANLITNCVCDNAYYNEFRFNRRYHEDLSPYIFRFYNLITNLRRSLL